MIGYRWKNASSRCSRASVEGVSSGTRKRKREKYFVLQEGNSVALHKKVILLALRYKKVTLLHTLLPVEMASGV
jgi:hypothetical protein